MSLDLTPSPGAARPGVRIRNHALMELKLLARQGEQLLIALVIPVLVLLGGSRAGGILGTDRPLQLVVPGVIALAVLASAFTSLAISTGFERRYGVLQHLGSTPLSPSGLFWGKAAALVVLESIQILVLVSLALFLGWEPPGPAAWPLLLLVVLGGTAALSALGLLLAGTLRAEVTLGLANLFFVLAVAFGGVVLPVDRLPDPLGQFVGLLPPGALGEAVRGVLGQGGSVVTQLSVLAVWSVLGWFAAARWFRWE